MKIYVMYADSSMDYNEYMAQLADYSGMLIAKGHNVFLKHADLCPEVGLLKNLFQIRKAILNADQVHIFYPHDSKAFDVWLNEMWLEIGMAVMAEKPVLLVYPPECADDLELIKTIYPMKIERLGEYYKEHFMTKSERIHKHARSVLEKIDAKRGISVDLPDDNGAHVEPQVDDMPQVVESEVDCLKEHEQAVAQSEAAELLKCTVCGESKKTIDFATPDECNDCWETLTIANEARRV